MIAISLDYANPVSCFINAIHNRKPRVMKKPIILVGVGEMGGVFARGFLRLGHPVHPVTRQMSPADAATQTPDPEMVLIAVGEEDLQPVLAALPVTWKERLCLLQNELLPNDWSGIQAPTVISVWFEKKPGMEPKIIIPSPAFGPQAQLMQQCLAAIGIPARVLNSEEELLFELALKNLYILTSNIAGLRSGGTVGELWEQHNDFTRQIAGEVIQIQEALTGQRLDSAALLDGMLSAFNGDPQHKCMGRSAPARLQRAIAHADAHQLAVPVLRSLQNQQSST
jgi:hypothetical protein